MASCVSCEAEIPPVDVEVGETLVCEECGTEHEVLAAAPLELALLDDEDLVDDEDEDESDEAYEEEEF
jgi:lysine biosynthesis protein LysW